jgi:phage tail-like protein
MSAFVPAARIDPYRSFNFLITLTRSAKSMSFGGYVVAPAVTVSQPVISISISIGGGAAAPRPAPPPPAPVAGFSECSGLELALDIEEYKEGGNNGTVLRLPTRAKWTNLKLKRGVALSDDLWLWHYGFVQGTVSRRDGVVTLQDEQQNPVKVWSFKRGLPVKWTGPSLNATQSQVAFEEIEIAHEGLTLL